MLNSTEIIEAIKKQSLLQREKRKAEKNKDQAKACREDFEFAKSLLLHNGYEQMAFFESVWRGENWILYRRNPDEPMFINALSDDCCDGQFYLIESIL